MQWNTTVIYFPESKNICKTQQHVICWMYSKIGVGIYIQITILDTRFSLCWRPDSAAAGPKCREATFPQAASMPSEFVLNSCSRQLANPGSDINTAKN
jgi:hypothetical protein